MTKLFISYSRKDIGFIRQLAGDLEKAGYDVWWDLTDLRGGDDWQRVIPTAIESSEHFIVVLSPKPARVVRVIELAEARPRRLETDPALRDARHELLALFATLATDATGDAT